MSSVLTRNVDDVLVVYLLDVRLVDASRIESLALELIRIAADPTTGKMILNLQNVSFMSSTMIGKLILLGKKAKAAKVKLRVCGANPDLSKVFVAMALNEELAIDPDEATALGNLK